ncbi:bifunctional hydroxymethylpyrimidine kinase/phosphomethylpyrimidine kinase [Tersicoccus sp. Bi-70]|uniref:bifunctional hydroxymethylpyrimidine kinase/phosphomethylpyrimidine kinase n=1 Tax=Tersicoccus sp. Bi-70 TaxID=1897634 RepID=UPI0009786F3B|nr:bifunctional hydroxymethylpyrimidine kinase/phosphomethylpyrimidine kinase [Tersicoccus sp. Bi-70]OMH36823.1 bifunctional hydroxymethylpyrimidine kinase/phosphomethylpyrimidine kinase [Tersicoccus sp. Bi-70]
MTVRILSIAGTDPTGGAGIQADLKSISALGGYGMAVVTCLVAQNTHGVRSIHTPPVAFLREQLDAVSDDVTIDAVKIGMLGNAEVATTVHAWLTDQRAAGRRFPVILDPVMVASSGDRLLDQDAEDAVRALAAAHADLLTPNLAELAILDGSDGTPRDLLDGNDRRDPAEDWERALAAGRRVAARTDSVVLVKGGHLPGERTPDALVAPDGTLFAELTGPRVATTNTHGTGCSLSSAVATLYARTGAWPASLAAAKRWLTGALAAADGLHVGYGTGPVHHGHHLDAAVDAYLADAETVAASEADAAAGSEADAVDNSVDTADATDTSSTGTGRFTDGLWQRSTEVRREIDELEFIVRLADGTLPEPRFRAYLAQDAAYLQAYSRALSALADSSAPAHVRTFFARGAITAATEETVLHRQWLGDDDGADLPIGPVTAQYIDFLLAHTGRESWQVGVAAVLPCYWLYAEIAATLSRGLEAHRASAPDPSSPAADGDHPYATWLAAYDDPGFQDAAAACRALVDEAAATADEATRRAMTTAFLRACELERDFFAAELPGPGRAVRAERATAAPADPVSSRG